MAFKPRNSGKGGGGGDREPYNAPAPRSGTRKARISLIVDLGTQKREPYEEKDDKGNPKLDDDGNPILRDQKPCQQVAIFADLTHDVVDYGGSIGKKPYRLLINKSFKGGVVGINFQVVPPTDAKGNRIQGHWRLPAQNTLNKLCKAVGMPHIAMDDRNNPESLDISLLLDQPFMCEVEVKETPDKNGKTDSEGKPLVYKNVNFKNAAPLIVDDDGKTMEVNPLETEARCITFDSAKKEDIKFIRSSLIKMIKLANDYAGSQMQKAIEAYEAEQGQQQDEPSDEQEQPEQKPAAPAKKAVKPKPPVKSDTGFDDMDDDTPF